MEYQKIRSSLDKIANQPSKFRTRNCVEINDDWQGTCNTNNRIKFKTTMLKSSLCDYSDVYLLVKETMTLVWQGAYVAAIQIDNNVKQVIFKNCAPFTDCITEINNTQVDNAKDLDVVMPMHNLIEYSDNYLWTTGNFWKYHKNEPKNSITDSN